MNNMERIHNEFDAEATEFANFLENNGYTAEEMEEAYYEMLGVGDEEKSTDRIKEISEMMNKMTDAGFPLNQIASLIHLKEKWENMVPDFYSFVESMSVSDNEKRMLKSIVENDRSGEVSVFMDGESIFDLNISVSNNKEAKSYQLLKVLKEILKHVPDNKKFEVTFTEN